MNISVQEIKEIIARADVLFQMQKSSVRTPTFEEMTSYLSNPDRVALHKAIADLSDDKRAELIAILWIGRDDFSASDLDRAIRHAKETFTLGPAEDASYVGGKKLLSAYLRAGMNRLHEAGKLNAV